MWRWIKRIVLFGLIALVGFVGISAALNWNLVQRLFLGGLKVYETTPPAIPADIKRPAILVFSKTNAFRHEEAIPAANKLFAELAQQNGWGYFQTENGATFSSAILSRFDAVIFNNVSGDVFTPDQRAAFKAFVENGGGWMGIHAAGDDSHKGWDWYMRDVIGTTFIGHPMKPQFQQALVRVEDTSHPASAGLKAEWRRTDEWYSFDRSPRSAGVHVVATLDEKTYNPVGVFSKDLRMGADHPIIWWRCVGKGRVLYSAMGHTAASFAEPEYRSVLLGATNWVLQKQAPACDVSAHN